MLRPLPGKYFVLHMEVVTAEGMVIRLSFSNLFKEFKSTSTWLQFPYLVRGKENRATVSSDQRSGSATPLPTPEASHWTFLALDLRSILSKYLHSSYATLKNIKLCANLLVKNVFISDIEYSPLPSDHPLQKHGYAQPLPREMAFPLSKGTEFTEKYDYIRFPSLDSEQAVKKLAAHSSLKTMPIEVAPPPPRKDLRSSSSSSSRKPGLVASTSDKSGKVLRSGPVLGAAEIIETVKAAKDLTGCQKRGFASEEEELYQQAREGGGGDHVSRLKEGVVHLYTQPGSKVIVHQTDDDRDVATTTAVRHGKVLVCKRVSMLQVTAVLLQVGSVSVKSSKAKKNSFTVSYDT